MESFFDVISSYPTNIFTIVLGIMLVFWIFAILGMFDIDIFPSDSGEDGLVTDIELDGEIPGFIGLLHTLGLTGVPLTLVISIIALIGFTLCYFSSVWILIPLDSDLIRYLGGSALLAASLAFALPVTAQIIKPMKPLFVKHFAPSKRDYIGHVCVVTSSSVNSEFGIGIVETSGPPIQVDIRAQGEEIHSKGDSLRIADYDAGKDTFDVISEEKFQQLTN